MNKNGTGVIPCPTSIRTYDYDIVCGAPSGTYPSYFCLPRDVMGTIKDQGSVGSCVAEVISTVAEELWRRRTGLSVEMSDGQVYGGFRKPGDNGIGMLVETALKLWMEKGVVAKSYLPELFEMPEMRKWVEKYPGVWDIAKDNTIGGYVALRGSNKNPKDTQIKDALTKYPYGLIAVSREYFGGCHCIMLVGWNDEKDTYIIKNSWGADYGDNGLKEIPKDAINDVWLILEKPAQMNFTDVPEDAWYYKNVKNVVLSGQMKGTSETTFEPNKTVTRAELAAVIDRINSAHQKEIEHLLTMIAERQIKEQE